VAIRISAFWDMMLCSLMNGGRHLLKDREKSSLILGSKEFESADVSQVAYPYKITM